MDKVKIQEIADEAGLSNGDLLDKAKELGFDVKAANSTISMEDAGILVDYAISGTLPKGFTKPGTKAKIKVVKKKAEAPVEEVVEETTAPEVVEEVKAEETVVVVSEEAPVVETVVEAPVKARPGIKIVAKEEVVQEKVVEEAVVEETPDKETVVVETVEETAVEETVVEEKPVVKEVRKRKGISVVSKKTEPEAAAKEGDAEKPKRRVLSRTGIKIVRKAKPAPVRAGTRISMGDQTPYIPKKKPKKGPAEARDTGKRIDIFNHDSMSTEIDSGFGNEEVVLLDFSDKNIYEEMMRQEQKRKEEMKKREAANGGPLHQLFCLLFQQTHIPLHFQGSLQKLLHLYSLL